MDKYTQPLSVDSTKGIPFYRNPILSSVSMESVPYFYVTRLGDRLDQLANVFYKDPKKWWVLAKANNIANGTLALPPGTSIYIPRI